MIAALLLGSNGLGGNNPLNVNGPINWMFIVVTAVLAAYVGVERVHAAVGAIPEILEPESDGDTTETSETNREGTPAEQPECERTAMATDVPNEEASERDRNESESAEANQHPEEHERERSRE